MKKFFMEFKKFVTRGNVIDLAVGIIIGGAFQKIVTSLVNDLLMPFISYITGSSDLSSKSFEWHGSIYKYGSFISSVIDFIIMAFIIFLLVKGINRLKNIAVNESAKKGEAEKVPDTKKCPFCLSDIPCAAVKCAHCTSDITDSAAETAAGTAAENQKET